jgi:hypothetical protein
MGDFDCAGVVKSSSTGCDFHFCKQERSQLQDKVAELSRRIVELEREVRDGKTDVRYWLDQYQSEVSKGTAYMNVIKVLTGRE